MYTQESDFYICLLSNNSMQYYRDNTLSYFTNLLSSPCNLDNTCWKVGVAEIAYNTYYNSNIYYQRRKKRSVDVSTQITSSSTSLLQPPKQLSDPIISKIHETNDMMVVEGETQSNLNGSFTPVMFIPKALPEVSKPIFEPVSQMPMPIWNERHQPQNEQEQSHDIPPDWNDNYHDLLLNSNRTNTNLNYIYVYTDIIKPRYVGDIKSRYLKIIPRLNTHADIIKFKHIEYCPLEKGYIENLTIQLMDIEGEKIDFAGSTSPTYVMLHFIKIK